jgi:solute carrier family 25, member 42
MAIRRRQTIPQELGDEEDLLVNQESFEGSDEDVEIVTGHNFVSRHIQTWPKEVRNLLAGGMAGMSAKFVVAPLDRIKILYQVSSVRFSLTALPAVMERIVQSEGFGALWKGNMATMVRVFPYSGIQFMTYDRCKGLFLRSHSGSEAKMGLTPLESLMAGMVAGSTSVLCTYPLDLTRAQLAVLKKQNNRLTDKRFMCVLRENYQQRGFMGGLWRGITPTIIGILPYSGIAFTLNEQAKREILYQTGRDLTTIERMICGALAGLIAQTLTYPIEVTRRRMQTVGLAGETAFSSLGGAPEAVRVSSIVDPRPPSMLATVRDLYLEQGVRGFFKGVTLNWIKGPLAFSISFTSYDMIQKTFLSREERAHRLPLRQRVTRRNL